MGRLLAALLVVLGLVTGIWFLTGAERSDARARAAGASPGDVARPLAPELSPPVEFAAGAVASAARPESSRTLPAEPREPPAASTLLVQGQVVDANGAPVPGVLVFAGDMEFGSESWIEQEPGSSAHNLKWRSRDVLSGEGSRRVDVVRGRTDEHGRFELNGRLELSTFFVHAESYAETSAAVQVEKGARDVRIVFRQPWRLFGSVLVEDPRDLQSLRLQVEGAALQAPQAYWLQRDGTFSAQPLASGVYRLVFLLGHPGRRLAEIKDVALAQDTDIGAIDLRAWIHRSRILLVGAEASDALPYDLKGEYDWRPSSTFEPWQTLSFQGREIVILSDVTPIDVRVRPAGHRGALLQRVSGQRELDLGSPLRVRLVLRTTGALPEPPWFLSCDLVQGGERVGVVQQPSWFEDARRELRFLVAATGKVRVRWKLERALEDPSRHASRNTVGGPVLPGHGREIEVLDVEDEQVFVLELDGAALSALSSEPTW